MRRVGINLLCFAGPQLAGAGRFFRNLVENLPPLPGTELHLYCQRQFDPSAHFKIAEGVQWTRVECPQFSNHGSRVLYEQTLLPAYAAGLDVLFSPCVSNPVVHPRLRTVTTIHDVVPFLVDDKYGAFQQNYVRAITRMLAASSTRIVTVSDTSRRDLVTLLGVDDDKIDVVYNVSSKPDGSEVTYEDFFLFVGTLQPAKNLETTIRSFAYFRRHYDTASHRLVIVGAHGWGGSKYKRLIHELDLEAVVDIAGYITDQELSRLYARCKGLILLSLYEGFGLPPLEALAWKKPSVVSDRSALPEVVGTTGIQVDPMDAVAAALALAKVAAAPEAYLTGRDKQLARYSPQTQVAAFLRAIGIDR